MCYINTIRNTSDGSLKVPIRISKEDLRTKRADRKCLMYVEAWVNHKLAKNTMADSGATHNFMTEMEVNWLNIKWHRDSGKMKIVNSVGLPILRIARKTTLKLGTWSSLVDFVIVKMDGFDVVLRMEFLLEHKVIPNGHSAKSGESVRFSLQYLPKLHPVLLSSIHAQHSHLLPAFKLPANRGGVERSLLEMDRPVCC